VPVALGKGTKKQPMMRQPPLPASRAPDDGDVGVALRAAYKSALDEAIPPEMLDLLSKLK
jgi:Anti-sigma factor NepR